MSTPLDKICIGDLVKVDRGMGLVKFIGRLEGTSGVYFGIELTSPNGDNSGDYNGRVLFESAENAGVLVSRSAIDSIIAPGEREASKRICVGDPVTSEEFACQGHVQFIGDVPPLPGVWYGIELTEQAGNHNGTFQNRWLWDCAPGYGICLSFEQISLDENRTSLVNLFESLPDSNPIRPTFDSVDSAGSVNELLPTMPPPGKVCLSDFVRVTQGEGTVRFIGKVKNKKGIYFGIEMLEPVGSSNGRIGDRTYFRTPQNYAIFTKPTRIQEIIERRPANEESRFTVGDIVHVAQKNFTGVVHFIGKTTAKQGDWYGIAMDGPVGKNNGSWGGIQYFECDDNHGVFVKREALRHLSLDERERRLRFLNGDDQENAELEELDPRFFDSQMPKSEALDENKEEEMMYPRTIRSPSLDSIGSDGGEQQHLDEIASFVGVGRLHGHSLMSLSKHLSMRNINEDQKEFLGGSTLEPVAEEGGCKEIYQFSWHKATVEWVHGIIECETLHTFGPAKTPKRGPPKYFTLMVADSQDVLAGHIQSRTATVYEQSLIDGEIRSRDEQSDLLRATNLGIVVAIERRSPPEAFEEVIDKFTNLRDGSDLEIGMVRAHCDCGIIKWLRVVEDASTVPLADQTSCVYCHQITEQPFLVGTHPNHTEAPAKLCLGCLHKICLEGTEPNTYDIYEFLDYVLQQRNYNLNNIQTLCLTQRMFSDSRLLLSGLIRRFEETWSLDNKSPTDATLLGNIINFITQWIRFLWKEDFTKENADNRTTLKDFIKYLNFQTAAHVGRASSLAEDFDDMDHEMSPAPTAALDIKMQRLLQNSTQALISEYEKCVAPQREKAVTIRGRDAIMGTDEWLDDSDFSDSMEEFEDEVKASDENPQRHFENLIAEKRRSFASNRERAVSNAALSPNSPTSPRGVKQRTKSIGFMASLRLASGAAYKSYKEKDVQDTAEQLTLILFDKFSKIRATELLGKAWSSKDKNKMAPNLVELIVFSEAISLWVKFEVVSAANLEERKRAIKKYGRVGIKMKEFHNQLAQTQIYAALDSPMVQKFEQAWAQIQDDSIREFVDETRQLISASGNFRNLRDAFWTLESPAVPFLGVFLKDAFIVDDVTKGSKIGRTNYDRMNQMFRVFQRLDDFRQKRFPYEPLEELQTQIKRQFDRCRTLDVQMLSKFAKSEREKDARGRRGLFGKK